MSTQAPRKARTQPRTLAIEAVTARTLEDVAWLPDRTLRSAGVVDTSPDDRWLVVPRAPGVPQLDNAAGLAAANPRQPGGLRWVEEPGEILRHLVTGSIVAHELCGEGGRELVARDESWPDYVRTMLSPRGALIVNSDRAVIRVRSTRDGSLVRRLSLDSYLFTRLLGIDDDGTVYAWSEPPARAHLYRWPRDIDPSTQAPVYRLVTRGASLPGPTEPPRSLYRLPVPFGRTAAMPRASWSADQRHLLLEAGRGGLCLVDLTAWKVVAMHKVRACEGAWLVDASTFVTVASGRLQWHDAGTGAVLTRTENLSFTRAPLAVSLDGQRAVALRSGGTELLLVERDKTPRVVALQHGSQPPPTAAFSPDGHWLAIGASSPALRLIDLTNPGLWGAP